MKKTGPRILIIDDESQIRRLLTVSLHAHGFQTIEAATGQEGVQQSAVVHPDLVILDLGLPDMSGMEVVDRIRAWSSVPIIVLTVKEAEEDKVLALDRGADDYITKPFGMGELVARIRVALRHTAKGHDAPILTFGSLHIDLAQRVVKHDGEEIKLTPTEYELLRVLATNAGRVMTHRQLLEQVWGGPQYAHDSQYLRVYIGHLRKKIERDPTRPELIITEPGIGYRLVWRE